MEGVGGRLVVLFGEAKVDENRYTIGGKQNVGRSVNSIRSVVAQIVLSVNILDIVMNNSTLMQELYTR